MLLFDGVVVKVVLHLNHNLQALSLTSNTSSKLKGGREGGKGGREGGREGREGREGGREGREGGWVSNNGSRTSPDLTQCHLLFLL